MRHRLDPVGVGIGLGLRAQRRAAVGAGAPSRPARRWSGAAPRARRPAAAPIRSMALLRSAISTSRAVNTFSSAATASARASRPRPAPRSASLLSRAIAMARRCSASSSAWRRSISAAWIAALLADALLLERSARSGCAPRRWPAWPRSARPSAACSRSARSRADLGALAARAISTSRCCVSRAYSLSRSISSDQLLGLQVLVADRDQRVLLDVVALLLAPLDLLGQARQALGVEGIARVEALHAGLVELRQRGALPAPGRSWSGPPATASRTRFT